IGLIEAQLSTALDPWPQAECYNQLHVQRANLRRFVECLARTTSLTALMQDARIKLQLLEQELTKPEELPSAESPFLHIDDVLRIEGSIESYDCAARLQVMQALRRRLAQLQLQQNVESKLFEWPSPA
ncbi:hypothetical protein KR222_001214, partial [Zaprionus bogoriensis]